MKTVFILGAGFSIPCGAPPQSKIIESILALQKDKSIGVSQKKLIDDYISKFKEFIDQNLFVSEDGLFKTALEDIFTPLDRCIIEDISFRDIDPKSLIGIRDILYALIAAAISKSICKTEENYIEKFVNYLITQTQVRKINPNEDNVAVISTNWDIILDNAIQKALKKMRLKDEDFAGVVDYCCYMSSLKDDKSIKPGLYALGKGKFNIKLLKLHGSMNWLICPRCQRLYVNFYKDFQGIYLIKKHYCKHCQENFGNKKHNSILLRTNLIMPTFLKSLNNFQIKLVWQNAGIELSEADKIVFIGYSLPQADFELRQLLSRMLKKNVDVRVVLTEYDKPINGLEIYSAGFRYKTFFGNNNINITYNGVEDYIENELTTIEFSHYN